VGSMVEIKDLYRERVNVAVELWDKVLRGEVVSRGELVNLLAKYYGEHDTTSISTPRLLRKTPSTLNGLSLITVNDPSLSTLTDIREIGI